MEKLMKFIITRSVRSIRIVLWVFTLFFLSIVGYIIIGQIGYSKEFDEKMESYVGTELVFGEDTVKVLDTSYSSNIILSNGAMINWRQLEVLINNQTETF